MIKKQLFFVAGTIFYATLPFYLSLVLLPTFISRKLRKYGLAFFLGFSCCLGFQSLFCETPLPVTAFYRVMSVKGYVESISKRNQGSQSFTFAITELNKRRLYSRILLTDYQKNDAIVEGAKLSLLVKLKPFSNFYNDGGRDRQKQMRFKRLYAKGYVKAISAKLGFQPPSGAKKIRSFFQNHITSLNLSKESQGLLESLTLGVREDLSRNWREVFQKTGTGHLIAISGLHVGIFAYAAYRLCFFFWCLSAWLCERVPAQRAAAVAAIIAAFCYSALTNFPVSALRAFIMLSLVMGAQITYRKPYLWDTFFTALAIVLVINPYSIYNYGFYLSFYAVFIIFSFCDENSVKLVRLQVVISLLMLPVSLYFFSYASLVSIPANLIAIPLVSFGVLPIAIISLLVSSVTVTYAHVFGWLFMKVSIGLFIYLKWLKHFSFLAIPLMITTRLQFIILTTFMWSFLKGYRRGLSAVLCILLFPMSFYSSKLAANEVKFSVLDIGHGLSTVLQTRKHILVYDTGLKYSSGFSLASIVIIPYLHHHRISRLDKIVISHADNDHSGGLDTLMKHYVVDEVITNNRRQHNHCHRHKSWIWDGVRFSFIRLPKIDNSDNNNSCVLKVDTGTQSILLTGDIEKKAERYLVDYKKEELRAAILLVPHHGSNTSSTYEFINAVNPQQVVISAGRMNRFSHPHAKVISRYKEKGCEIFSTDRDGQVTWTLGKERGLRNPVIKR